MEELSQHEIRNSTKNEKDEKLAYNHNHIRSHCGLCCICRKPPIHSRSYYGHVFCTECFYKYIFSPTKNDCSGDVTKKEEKGESDPSN